MQLHLRGSLGAPDKDTKSLYNRANKDTHHTSYMYPKRFLKKVATPVKNNAKAKKL